MKRLEEPCWCGWKYPGFHLCVDLTLPPIPIVEEKVKKKRKRTDPIERTEEHRENHAAAMRDVWAKKHASTKERDDEMMRKYVEDNRGARDLAKEYGIAYQTVLSTAARYGVTRPRGVNVRWEKVDA